MNGCKHRPLPRRRADGRRVMPRATVRMQCGRSLSAGVERKRKQHRFFILFSIVVVVVVGRQRRCTPNSQCSPRDYSQLPDEPNAGSPNNSTAAAAASSLQRAAGIGAIAVDREAARPPPAHWPATADGDRGGAGRSGGSRDRGGGAVVCGAGNRAALGRVPASPRRPFVVRDERGCSDAGTDGWTGSGELGTFRRQRRRRRG